MRAHNTAEPDAVFYSRYAAYYAQCLERIRAVLTAVGDTSAMEPMERSATCKEALARIVFLAEATPTTADLRSADLGDDLQ